MLNDLLQMHLNCSKNEIQEKVEATGDLIGNKIAKGQIARKNTIKNL